MRVVVIGAGLAGLVAGRQLNRHGVETLLVERARVPGGRLATRRIGEATLDHGAQFFTVRTPDFAATVEDWVGRGLLRVWNHGFVEPDGHPRYVAPAGMNSLARDLATSLEVQCDTMAFAIRTPRRHEAGSLEVVIDDGTVRHADAVIVTCPLPQSFSLLIDAGIDLDEGLFRTDYDRTLALLAVLDRPPAMPEVGGVQQPNDVLAFVGDNASKGVSALPALTVHASAGWSDDHWDDADEVILDELQRAVRPWLGAATVVERQLKRWRFATPRSISSAPCWVAPSGDVVVAGDAFAGPRIEGAHNSGLAAARALLERGVREV